MFKLWKSDTDVIKLKCVLYRAQKMRPLLLLSSSESCLLAKPFLAFGGIFTPFSLQ